MSLVRVRAKKLGFLKHLPKNKGEEFYCEEKELSLDKTYQLKSRNGKGFTTRKFSGWMEIIDDDNREGE